MLITDEAQVDYLSITDFGERRGDLMTRRTSVLEETASLKPVKISAALNGYHY